MQLLKVLKIAGYSLVGMLSILQLESCANIVPPSGGPRDSIPPYLVIAKPKDSAVNVKPNELLLGFNEYITLNSIQENLIISPSIANTPLIDARLNMVRIKIKDSLKANTTYSLQFGNAIQDVNEANIAKNFMYVFSTGNQIDTGHIKGKVTIAETGMVDSTLIVLLHPANTDTAIFKKRPDYYTKLNGKGQFEFKFLPDSLFDIFVLPNDYTKRYDDSTKFFAFLDTPIQVSKSTDSIALFAFQAFKKIDKKRIASSSTKNIKRDSSILKFSNNLNGADKDILSALQLNFETPISYNTQFPIQLTDTNYQILEGMDIQIDTATKQTIQINYHWPAQTKFKLVVPKNAIKDSLNNSLVKADTLSFITRPTNYYGSALLRINGYQKLANPILLLIQENKIKYSYPIMGNILRIPLLAPGEYGLKILMDSNKNGIWDTGNYGKLKLAPEQVKHLQLTLNIRADWDNEMNLIIN